MASSGNVRFFAVVRRDDRVVIATYLANRGSRSEYEDLVSKMARSVDLDKKPKLVLKKDSSSINYDSDASAMYIAITAADYPQRMSFKLLAELKDQFSVRFGSSVSSATSGSLSGRSKNLFSSLSSTYDTLENVDKIALLQKETGQIKDRMHDNINMMLQRGDNLNDLEEQALGLAVEARTYSKTAEQLKKSFAKRNILLAAILLLICFGVCLTLVVATIIIATPTLIAFVNFVVIPAYKKLNDKGSGMAWF
ncbi:hypothetical protein J8273_8525 [Carpediemonas membranifera]|uniref:Uncharacterized protein n=1 Tax=Carpediemonas membranifera TaxID=201153 RepID=A0A8J6DZ21_9EUKA|nr:hypothetical protein J8273_8525 [Carpediemonas membranifera]|eukprot:KAG9389846.1 hypothetical protein J8273_8525 [Carpediemonas membranifera]